MNRRKILASFLSAIMILPHISGFSYYARARQTAAERSESIGTASKVALATLLGTAAVGIPLIGYMACKLAESGVKKNFQSHTDVVFEPSLHQPISAWAFSIHNRHNGRARDLWRWNEILNAGKKFEGKGSFPDWRRGGSGLIAGAASYLGDIVNGCIAKYVKEVRADVYEDFAETEETAKLHPGNLIDSVECKEPISELDEARIIEREFPDAKGSIGIVDATNNVSEGGNPAYCNAQEESLVAKGMLGAFLLSHAAALYYAMGSLYGHQPWNCIFLHDVPFYPAEYLEETVSMRQDLKPERVPEIKANPGAFYKKCDKFHVLGIAAPTSRQAEQFSDSDLEDNFVKQFRQIYSVAREHKIKYLIMVKFGTGAFAKDKEKANAMWKRAHDKAFKLYGGGVKEYIVSGPKLKKDGEANRSYFNRAIDALEKLEPISAR